MGLDLYLVQNKNFATGMHYDESWNWDDEVELCYGRKTWNISDFFTEDSKEVDEGWIYQVSHETWTNFIKTIQDSPEINDEFHSLEDIIDKCWKDAENVTDEEYDRLVNFVENIYPGNPTLGYEWEAAAILRWYNDRDKVEKAFKETPNNIYLVRSY